MKKYNVDKIIKEIKRRKREEQRFDNMLNNLLPKSIEELREVIGINSIINQDYY